MYFFGLVNRQFHEQQRKDNGAKARRVKQEAYAGPKYTQHDAR